MKHYDLIIVGAGIAGASAAYEFSKQGDNVLLLEQYQFLHTKGSSQGGSRIFRHAYENPNYIKLAIEAGELWRELEHNLKEKLVFPTGGIDIGTNDNKDLQDIQTALQATAQDYEVLSAHETNKRFPAFQLSSDMIALYQKDAAILAATRAVNALLLAAALAGADLQDNTELVKIDMAKDRVTVKTNLTSFSASKIILAAGSWLDKLLPDLKLNLDVEQQQVIYLKVNKPHLHSMVNMPIFINRNPAAMVYGFPLIDSPTAIKVANHLAAPKIEIENRNFELNSQRAKNTIAQVRSFMPYVSDNLEDFATCLYTKTKTEDFIIDLHPEYDNLLIAGGFSGHGFKFGSLLGKLFIDKFAKTGKYDLDMFGF